MRHIKYYAAVLSIALCTTLRAATESSHSTFSRLEGPETPILKTQVRFFSDSQNLGGIRLAALGDVNGDSVPDVGVGLLPPGQFPRNGFAPGNALILAGGKSGLSESAWFAHQGSADQYLYSYIFRPADDQNQDGVQDWITGFAGDRFQSGAIFLWTGSAQAPANPVWSWSPASGMLVRANSVGDIDGDALPDLVVSISSSSRRNKLLLFRGSGAGVPEPASWSYESDQPEDDLGESISAAGDLDGDGVNDFMVGAPGWRTAKGALGRVAVFYGKENGTPEGPFWIASGRGNGDRFGSAIAGKCDLDGDGRPDLAIGAPGIRQNGQHGYVLVFLGNVRREPPLAFERSGSENDRRYGAALSWLPDFNGDGRPDLAVGSPRASRQMKENGAVEVLCFEPGRQPAPCLTLLGSSEEAHFGAQLISPGDLNGDRLSDLVVASPNSAQPRIDLVYGEHFPTRNPSVWASFPVTSEKTSSTIAETPEKGLRASRSGIWTLSPFVLLLATGVWRFHHRRVAAVRRESRQKERTRIARDLHDHFGSVIVELAGNEDRAPSIQSPAQPLRAMLDQIIWRLETGDGTLEGFATFLVEYVPERLRNRGIEPALDIPLELPDVRISAEKRHALASITSEALNNALRHARPKTLRVRLTYQAGVLNLRIEDDGCGFDPAALDESRHGLRGMRTRLQEIGGTLTIKSARQDGTRLEVRLPIP